MRERAKELTAATGNKRLLAKITEIEESDRVLAEQLHVIITAGAPALSSRTWHGIPAHAMDGNTV